MPKIVDHENYRKQLLSQCFQLFAQKGYSAITMRQMAEGLGVSTGTLYHYFPSKQAIFEQMMLDRLVVSIRQFDANLAPLETVRERIFGVFQHFQREEKEAIDELFLYIEYHQQQQREGEPNNLLQQIYNRLQVEAIHLLGSDDPQILQFLFSMIDGLLLATVYGQTVDWLAQANIVSTTIETLLNQEKAK
jgi:AcrR family transcriptional regulator